VAPRRWLLAAGGQAHDVVDLSQRLTAAWSDARRQWPLNSTPRLKVSVVGKWQGASACVELLREARQFLRSLDHAEPGDRRHAAKRRSTTGVGSL
jgi:hypothetical protein